MHERIREHNRDIQLAGTQTSTVSEHANKTEHFPIWNEVKFVGCFLMLQKALLGSYCVVVWVIVSCLLFLWFYITW